MLISLFCFILMGSAVLIYFINQTTSSSYGKRLEDIEKYPVADQLKDLENYFSESEGVISRVVRLQGKIIYIDVEVQKDLTNEKIENMATTSLEKLTAEQKGYYDIQFAFNREGMSSYEGSKAANNTVIAWTNYSVDTDDAKTEK